MFGYRSHRVERRGPPGDGRTFVRLLAFAVAGLTLAACQDSRDPIAPGAVQARFSHGSSSSQLSNLQLYGVARWNGAYIRLAGPGGSGIGAAWLPQKIDVTQGFTANFTFQLTTGTGGNTQDGLAFVVQSLAADALGGGHLGYNEITQSVAVEFDTFINSWDAPYVGPHVSVQPGGDQFNSASLGGVAAPGLANVEQHATVVYTHASGGGSLEVFLGGNRIINLSGVDLPAYLGGTDAWIGFTGHSTADAAGQAHDLYEFDFRAGGALYPAEILVTGSVIQGATVVATNTDTGEKFFEITDEEGMAYFLLPPGNYVFSVYRFRIQNPLQMVIWPYDTPGGDEETNLGAYLPVIYDANADETLIKNPSNLLKALIDNGVNLGPAFGGPGLINLQMPQGATLQCTFLDPNGNPISPTNQRVFGVVPLGLVDPSLLPPLYVPQGFSRNDAAYLNSLPRGIPFGIAKIANGCSLPGVPEGLAVLETDPIDFNGKKYVYRASRGVGPSGNFPTVAGPSPYLIGNQFLYEPIGDATGPRDFGNSIYFGWNVENPSATGIKSPGRTFVVTSQFRGNGIYNLDVWRSAVPNGTPGISIAATCEAKRCKVSSTKLPSGVTAAVSGVSADMSGVEFGTVVWEITLPTRGPWFVEKDADDSISFRIWAGGSRSNASDLFNPPSPWVDYLVSTRASGYPGTFMVGEVF